MFKNVGEIPKDLITHNKTLRGYVEGIVDGDLLSVQHVPIFFRNLEKRKQFFGQDATPFHVTIAGIEPRSGCLEHLQKEVILQPIRMVPLAVNPIDTLQAVIYLKKGLLSRSMCLNEHLIEKGLAVVKPDHNIPRSRFHNHFVQKLLTAEVTAERKGHGLWKRPSLTERFQIWKQSLRNKLPFVKQNQK
eukprot:gene15022-16572_t